MIKVYPYTDQNDSPQVPSSPNLWSRHDPKVWGECLCLEEARRPRLRRHSPGTRRSFILARLCSNIFLLLQCWIPVLEGILPNSEHNSILLDLAFDLATWHAYAKLRLHTTHTIASLRSQTKELGRLLRPYANKLCPKYATKLLPGEAAAAYRRKAANIKKSTSTSQKSKKPSNTSIPKGSGFNLKTYKIHALGDYADYIEQFGPTDCFTTGHVRPSPLPQASSLTFKIGRA